MNKFQQHHSLLGILPAPATRPEHSIGTAWKCFCLSCPWNQLPCGDGGCGGLRVLPLLSHEGGGFSALQVLPLISLRDEGCGLLCTLPLLSCGDRIGMPSGSCPLHPPSASLWEWRLWRPPNPSSAPSDFNNCKTKPSISIYPSCSFHEYKLKQFASESNWSLLGSLVREAVMCPGWRSWLETLQQQHP